MIVIKIGGDIFQKGLTTTLASDIKQILSHQKTVIIHGGGDEVTETAQRLGKKQTFVTSPGGIRSRYTDRETIEIFTMVMAGKINKMIVRWLQENDVKTVGLSGIDAALIRAKRKKRLIIIDDRNRRRIIEGGFTGKITNVNASLLQILLDNDYLPVIAPIALGEDSEFLNVDADRAAAQVAGELKADVVIFLTDVAGVRLGDEYVKKIFMRDFEKILTKTGPGMDKKLIASAEALKLGAKEAVIASGFADEPISRALNHINGTVISYE